MLNKIYFRFIFFFLFLFCIQLLKAERTKFEQKDEFRLRRREMQIFFLVLSFRCMCFFTLFLVVWFTFFFLLLFSIAEFVRSSLVRLFLWKTLFLCRSNTKKVISFFVVSFCSIYIMIICSSLVDFREREEESENSLVRRHRTLKEIKRS